MKIQVMTFVTLLVMAQRERLHMLIWVIVVSLGFYGVKGGVFTILTGAQHHVLGPPKSFISGNTEIGLALIMTLPLMRYLQLNTSNKWVRRGLTVAMLLTGVAILGTYSRGALLGGVAMALFLLIKSRKKVLVGIVVLVSIPIMISMMPGKWFGRMDTIQNYQGEQSAMERIFAWRFGYKIGIDRITGGGFGSFTGDNYQRFAPDVVIDALSFGIPEYKIYQSAHSIYFGVLGEHGVIGLVLFLFLGVLWWRTASSAIRQAKNRKDLKWAVDLAAMIQASLVGYAVGGAFLSLEYFDLVYHLIAVTVLVKVLVEKAIVEEEMGHPDSPPHRSSLQHVRRSRTN